MTLHKNWIAGEWVEGKAVRENINPSDLSDIIERADPPLAAVSLTPRSGCRTAANGGLEGSRVRE